MPLSAIPTERPLIVWHPAITPPDGYIKANGAVISRSVYSWLFSKIGTTFGAGNGSTTFDLPDLRGEFLRGWSDGRGVDAGRVFGSGQLETRIESRVGATLLVGFLNEDSTNAAASVDTHATSTALNRLSEYKGVRPRNVAGLYCIAYMP